MFCFETNKLSPFLAVRVATKSPPPPPFRSKFSGCTCCLDKFSLSFIFCWLCHPIFVFGWICIGKHSDGRHECTFQTQLNVPSYMPGVFVLLRSSCLFSKTLLLPLSQFLLFTLCTVYPLSAPTVTHFVLDSSTICRMSKIWAVTMLPVYLWLLGACLPYLLAFWDPPKLLESE